MTTVVAICLAIGASQPESLVGDVRVYSGVGAPSVSLALEEGSVVPLGGNLVDEIRRLQSIKVELIGQRDGKRFIAKDYRILDVGGGFKPIVGILVREASGRLQVRDGDGTPLPLSLSARSKARLDALAGAKVWVYGKKLVSGELRVRRYGVLREPAKTPPAPLTELPTEKETASPSGDGSANKEPKAP